jgi:hypothetical protein
MWHREAPDQAMLGFTYVNIKRVVSDNREFIILRLQPAANDSIVNCK